MSESPENVDDLLDAARVALAERLEGQWPETSTDHWIPWVNHHLGHHNLCRPCAEALVEWLLPALEEIGADDLDDMFVDGDWASQYKRRAFCDFCGVILRAGTTEPRADHCVKIELAHFVENGPDNDYWVLKVLHEVNGRSAPAIVAQAVQVAKAVLAEAGRG